MYLRRSRLHLALLGDVAMGKAGGMSPLYRFVYPDPRWVKIAGWGRILSSGTTVGLLIGANPRAWCLGFQWWECGFCVHLGPLNIGYGWLEEVKE